MIVIMPTPEALERERLKDHSKEKICIICGRQINDNAIVEVCQTCRKSDKAYMPVYNFSKACRGKG